jgi:GDP-6-deoxy-D-talose 4-dehydrogenase
LKILLTGANGFTGRFFAAQAVAAGHDVEALQTDLTGRQALTEQVLAIEPDAVVHLAAISFVGHADENAFYAVNVIGTTNLLTALTKLPKPPRCVMLASSANVYGNSMHSPIAETQQPAPISHYATSKMAMEFMAHGYEDRLPIIITRPFNYTGPGQDLNFVIPKLVDHFARRAPTIALGNIEVQREFNDVQMVCNAYLQLLQYGEAGETYNICSGKPFALQYVIDLLTRITEHSIKVEVDPAFVRANEVLRLCGSPAKIGALLAKHGAALAVPFLDATLRRMLAAAHNMIATNGH